jgi:hypothetical protein
MRAPKIIAAVVALFLAATALQTICWRERPPEGWRPAWWQSRTWAQAGIFLVGPAWLGAGVVSIALGHRSPPITPLGFAIAAAFYVVAAYFIVYFAARWVAKQFSHDHSSVRSKT